MTIDDLHVRDFDEESDGSDSETELLIRHHDGPITTRKVRSSSQQQQQTLHNENGSLFYSPPKRRNQKTTFLSHLFGVVGNTSKKPVPRSSRNLTNTQQTKYPATTATTTTLRFRNDRSRERTQSPAASNQTVLNNNAKYGNNNHSNNNNNSSSSSFSLNFTASDLLEPVTGMTGGGSYNHYSDTLQMSGMDTQPKKSSATTATSPGSSSGVTATANGVLQTVIDPDNGSTTVFYQKNRRKSKRRSFGNMCKMCLCG